MKNYFLHLLKKNALPFVIFTLLCALAYVVPLAVENYNYWNSQAAGDISYGMPYLYLGELSTVLGILAVFIPISLFSYKMNRLSVDMHFSLPISRTKLVVANFLVGLILLYGSYTIAYWLGFIVAAMKIRRLYLIYYLYQYLASLLPAFILYAVTAFLYTRANTEADGVLAVLGGLFIAMTAAAALSLVSGAVVTLDFLPFWSLNEATISFRQAIVLGRADLWFSANSYGSPFYNRAFWDDVCLLVGGILWTLAAIAATIGLIRSEKNCKAENCGQISESIFCYRGQLPVYAFLLSTLCISMDFNIADLALLLGLAFLVYVMAIVYKRSLKIGWKFAVVLGLCLFLPMPLYYLYCILHFMSIGVWF